jgi:hypothetical protein
MSLCYPITWQDWFELLLLIMAIYKLHSWLSCDTRVPLLVYVYGYCGIVLMIYYAPLATLMPLISIVTPIMCVVAILLHKNSLQKDIIPYKRHIALHDNTTVWLELVFRSVLNTMNDNRIVAIVFEYTDILESFMYTPYTLCAKVQQELLSMLLQHTHYQNNEMLWVTHTGIIVSNKAVWQRSLAEKETITDASTVYTFKTDCLICIVNQDTRTAVIIVHGTESGPMTMQQAHTLIVKHLNLSMTPSTFRRAYYEKYNSVNRQRCVR